MFPDRLELLLRERNIQKKDMLHDLGLSINSFMKWKKQSTMPSGTTLKAIADYLGVPVGEVMEQDAAPLGFDDFTYAIHAEASVLTDEDKQILLGLARQLADRRRNP